MHDAQKALGIDDTDRRGHARYGARLAGAIMGWQEGGRVGDVDPSFISSDQLTALLWKPVFCDLRLGDVDWQRPLDLRPKRDRPDGWDERTFGFHDLRHTAATLALEGGAPPHVVQAILGHHSATITLERYAQATSDGLAATAKALDI